MLPLDFEMKPPPRPWVDFTLDYHPLVTVTYERTRDAAYMVSRGINQNTIKDEFGERVTSTSTSRDLYEIDGPGKGRWTWDSTVEGKRIESRGFSPVGGGPGTFTSHLQTVPAPPGVFLAGLGGTCLLAGRLGRRLFLGPTAPASA
jgi:hypothetical protein